MGASAGLRVTARVQGLTCASPGAHRPHLPVAPRSDPGNLDFRCTRSTPPSDGDRSSRPSNIHSRTLPRLPRPRLVCLLKSIWLYPGVMLGPGPTAPVSDARSRGRRTQNQPPPLSPRHAVPSCRETTPMRTPPQLRPRRVPLLSAICPPGRFCNAMLARSGGFHPQNIDLSQIQNVDRLYQNWLFLFL